MDWKPKKRTVHRADKIRSDGAVSALCFSAPRAIDLGRATWTNRDEAVTCPKCLRILEAKKVPNNRIYEPCKVDHVPRDQKTR